MARLSRPNGLLRLGILSALCAHAVGFLVTKPSLMVLRGRQATVTKFEMQVQGATKVMVTKSQIQAATDAVRAKYSPIATNRMDALLIPEPSEQAATKVSASMKLPKDLPAGAYMRVGPNPRPGSSISGLLDADGMVHSVVLPPPEDRSPEEHYGMYSHTWIRTSAFKKEEEVGQEIFQGTISQAPRGWPMLGSIVNNVVRGGQICKDSCNTALSFHGGRLLALMEQCLPSQLQVTKEGAVRTVASLSDLEGSIPKDPSTGGALAAHSKVDPATGESMSFTYNLNPPSARHDVFASDGKLAHQTTVPLPAGVMIHDLAITKEFSVLLDLPLTFRAQRLLLDKFPIEYEKDSPARLGLLPRYGEAEEVEWFGVQACMCLHTINAFERADGRVVVQGMRVEPEGAASYISRFTPAFPYQWVLDRTTGACVEERYLADTPGEFPTLNPNFVGREARFAFAVNPSIAGPVTAYGGKTEATLYSRVVKYDLQEGGVRDSFELPENLFFVSEPTFVPKLGASAEEQGYLALYASEVDGWGRQRGSQLMFLDAADLSSGPVSSLALPTTMGYGLHSEFVPWDALA